MNRGRWGRRGRRGRQGRRGKEVNKKVRKGRWMKRSGQKEGEKGLGLCSRVARPLLGYIPLRVDHLCHQSAVCYSANQLPSFSLSLSLPLYLFLSLFLSLLSPCIDLLYLSFLSTSAARRRLICYRPRVERRAWTSSQNRARVSGGETPLQRQFASSNS